LEESGAALRSFVLKHRADFWVIEPYFESSGGDNNICVRVHTCVLRTCPANPNSTSRRKDVSDFLDESPVLA
jgi:hypothetical protein